MLLVILIQTVRLKDLKIDLRVKENVEKELRRQIDFADEDRDFRRAMEELKHKPGRKPALKTRPN